MILIDVQKDELKDLIAQAVREGLDGAKEQPMTVSQIAKVFNVKPQTVSKWARKRGIVPMNSTGWGLYYLSQFKTNPDECIDKDQDKGGHLRVSGSEKRGK